MNKTYIFLIIFLLIALLPAAQAIPPVTQVRQFTEGYVIADSPQDYIKQGTMYQHNFFLYNLSTGSPLDNSTIKCTFYMADSYGGVLFIEDVMYIDGEYGYWATNISENYLNDTGLHAYGTKCNSTSYGGENVGYFYVTESGMPNEPEYVLPQILALIASIAFLMMLALIIRKPLVTASVTMLGLVIMISTLTAALSMIQGNSGYNVLEANFRAMMIVFRLMIGACLIWMIVWTVNFFMKSGDKKTEEME